MSSVSSVSRRSRPRVAAPLAEGSADRSDAAAAAPPRVVLAGRPNAGKSTLFNRLLRRRKALVDPSPGVTRDTNEAIATWDGRAVLLVDTGGFETETAGHLDREVATRSLEAARRADLVVYLIDGKDGLSPADEAAARVLRRLGTPVLWVVNKVDSPAREQRAVEFHRLGAEILTLSAEHGHGVGDLIDAILARVDTARVQPAPDGIRVGVIGRPNVGKSSLVNRLLGFPRALVHDMAGTTRDAVDTPLEVDGVLYVLVDTAGVRRRSRIQERVERSATGSALQALGRSDVAVLVVDAALGVTAQDQRLAAHAWREGRGLVVVANKRDLCAEVGAERLVESARRALPGLAGVPVLPVSARTGAGVDRILPTVRRVAAAHDAEIKTARLNEVVTEAVRELEPPVVAGRRPRIYYATQVGRRPPTIVVFASAPSAVPASYQRYLQKRIADAFRLRGTPVRLQLRPRR